MQQYLNVDFRETLSIVGLIVDKSRGNRDLLQMF